MNLRKTSPEEQEKIRKLTQLMFRFNQTMPYTKEYTKLMRALFQDHLGEDSFVMTPVSGFHFNKILIGKHVMINAGFLAMARGGIVIKDNVLIAANMQILTNNHDCYDRDILPASRCF